MRTRFGPFQINEHTRELLLHDQPVELQPRVFDLLVHLVRNRDRIVPKEELLETLWSDVIVTDASIQRAVSLLRTTLRKGGCADAVHTHARHGYRFQLEEQNVFTPEETRPADRLPGLRHEVASADTPALRPYASRISVLPFESVGGTPEDDRLARGFWEDVIIELARFPALGVIAARSVGASSPGVVDYLVVGSIRRLAGMIRVSAQLLDARTHQQLWADRYDRREEEMFAIQDEITARVANALHARIDEQNLAAARRRSISALAAYEAWLRGFDLLRRGTLAADEEARGLFQRALEIDPQFARGYAGLSLSYFNEWSCSAWDRWEETQRRSFDYAQQAAALDPNDQMVQLILGRIQQYRRRFAEAEHHLQRALALAPNDAETLIQLGNCFAYQGQPELAIDLAERSLDLNPLCPAWHFPYAAIPRFVSRRYDEAMALLQKTPPALMVDLPAFSAAAAAYAGDAEQAVMKLAEFDQLFRERIVPGREPEPQEDLLWLRHVNPFRRESDVAHLVDGVLRARAFQRQPKVSAPRSRATEKNPALPEAAAAPRLFSWPIANTFRKEGVQWTLCYERHVVHLPELKGFRDIAYLLDRPNEEVHCLTLAGRDDAGSTRGDNVLDERARREYQERIRDLRAEVAAAADANDPGRERRAQEELEALLAQIARATGLGGRSRKLGDSAEKARTAVTWRIRSAIKKVAEHHPAFGGHLENSLRTGVFCRYSPEKLLVWEV